MNATPGRSERVLTAAHPGDERQEQLLGIGAAAQRAGVSQRALRYYQQIGLTRARTGISKDVWMLGIGVGLLADGGTRQT
jgi:hypothetical protein